MGCRSEACLVHSICGLTVLHLRPASASSAVLVFDSEDEALGMP